MSTYARAERTALADLMLASDPGAPTLCEGWQVRDLAAHLVLRERRLDAAPGIAFPPLRAYTERVQRRIRDGAPWPVLVARFRSGPPPWLRMLDEQMNLVEIFVHHEDVRRGGPEQEPRELETGEEQALWRSLSRFARILRLRLRGGLTVVAPGLGSMVVRSGEPHATLTGRPGELVLFLTGRRGAQVEVAGPPTALEALEKANLSL